MPRRRAAVTACSNGRPCFAPSIASTRPIVTDRLRVGFVGAGRVGKGLSLALTRAGYAIAGVAGRDPREKQRIVDESDLVFLTVPDDALSSVCRELEWEES